MSGALKFAVRSLLKSPGFTVVAVLTLALGIGANTALFSLIKAVLIQPFPYPHPERLVVLWEDLRDIDRASIAWPSLTDWQRDNRTFTAIGGLRGGKFRLTGAGVPEMVDGAQVSAAFFDAMGLPMKLGRAFTATEDKPGAQPLAVVSHGFWQRRFGGEKDVIGGTLRLNGVVHTIVGVLPPEYDLLEGRPEIWMQLGRMSDQPGWQSRGDHPGIYALGRMKSGVTLEQALLDLKRVAAQAVQPQIPGLGVRGGETLVDNAVGGYRRGLLVLLAAVGVVLLIACANVANLLMTRAAARRSELAVRSTLGASPVRLMRQMLLESALLAGAGGALGLAVALAVRNTIVALRPTDSAVSALFERAQLDGGVLAATFVLSALTVVLFGLWPAWKSSRPELRAALQAGGRAGSAYRGAVRTRETLLIVQVALAVVLLTGAGLLLKSLARAQAVDLGFDPQGVLSARLTLPQEVYDSNEKVRVFNERVMSQVTAIAGVQSVALASDPPLETRWQTTYAVEDRPLPSPGQWPFAQMSIVSDDYFSVMGMALLRGRTFGPQDVRGGPRTVIVDRAFAQRYWSGRDPIGKSIRFGDGVSGTVVGVVPSVRTHGYALEPKLVQAYTSARQVAPRSYMLLARTQGDPTTLAGALRRAVMQVDPDQPLSDISPFELRVAKTLGAAKLYSFLLTALSGLAMLLAAIGLYGVLAFQVASRTRDFGIRMALGAQRADVLRQVLGRGMALVAGGVFIGLAGAFASTRLLSGLLFGVAPSDPSTFVLASLVLGSVALCASYLPARRATKVDPMVALRAE